MTKEDASIEEVLNVFRDHLPAATGRYDWDLKLLRDYYERQIRNDICRAHYDESMEKSRIRRRAWVWCSVTWVAGLVLFANWLVRL